jgi:hypothetical protein
VGQSGAVMVVFMINENLGFVLQAPESGRMHNSVAVACKAAARRHIGFGD